MNVAQQLHDILTAADCHQLHATYGGVGARKTPVPMLRLMSRIATFLDAAGWTLSSGGAEGADEAFDHVVTRAEIFLPWPGFAETNHRANPLPVGPGITIYERPTMKAARIASQFHPKWHDLRQSVQRLMARNTHEILGRDCETPVSMVVTWTPDGSTGITTDATGGTGQALRIAYDRRIPIFNLALKDHREAWEEVIR
jgi:hypothetical protein